MQAGRRTTLIAKEKVEASDYHKASFLSNLSHEIRTPMNGILGFAELLKRPGLTDDDQQKYFRVIEISAKRMLNTINDLVDISKLESGQISVTIAEINIINLLKEIYTSFKPFAEEKGLDFCCRNIQSENIVITKTDKGKLFSIKSHKKCNSKYS